MGYGMGLSKKLTPQNTGLFIIMWPIEIAVNGAESYGISHFWQGIPGLPNASQTIKTIVDWSLV